MKRLFVIGLDSLDPNLLERWWGDLPNISALGRGGACGRLLSTHPPITVPAWTSATTGKSPGELGLYGFKNRTTYLSYDSIIVDSTHVRFPRVWDILSRRNKKSVVVGVPQTYPVGALNGWLVSDFLTPPAMPFTYPSTLQEEIRRVCDRYVFDVEGFRTEDKNLLLGRVYEKTEKHLKVVKYLTRTKDWDFFMFVEMGPDRVHHGFWSHMDPSHRRYRKGNPFEDAVRDYYRYIDREVGELLSILPPETAVLLMSDHGAKRSDGGICINEWLVREGLLKLKRYPKEPTGPDRLEIDWERTVAWAEGGYYGRVYVNLVGREPSGRVREVDYEEVLHTLKTGLESIPSVRGEPIPTRACRPTELYSVLNGVPPDLMVYFGDLSYRAVSSVGHGGLHSTEHHAGPDDANHDWHGVWISSGVEATVWKDPSAATKIMDIGQMASVVLRHLT